MDQKISIMLFLGLVVVASGCIDTQGEINPLDSNICDKNLPAFNQEVQVQEDDMFWDEGTGYVWGMNGQAEIITKVDPRANRRVQNEGQDNRINISENKDKLQARIILVNETGFEQYTGLQLRMGSVHGLMTDEEESLPSEHYETVCQKGLSENSSFSCSLNPDSVDSGSKFRLVTTVSVEGCGVKEYEERILHPAEIMEVGETFENEDVRLQVRSVEQGETNDGWTGLTFNITLSNKAVSPERAEDGITGRYRLIGESGEEIDSNVNGPYNILEGYSETDEVVASFREDQEPQFLVFQDRWSGRKPLAIYRVN